MKRLIIPALAMVALSACASAGGAGGASATRTDPDVLTSAEIAENPDIRTAYEAVRRLRPSFLRSRGPTSIRNQSAGAVIVYLNGVQAGGINYLRQISIMDVKEIRYLSAGDATTRYGTGHTGGVIEVTTGA